MPMQSFATHTPKSGPTLNDHIPTHQAAAQCGVGMRQFLDAYHKGALKNFVQKDESGWYVLRRDIPDIKEALLKAKPSTPVSFAGDEDNEDQPCH